MAETSNKPRAGAARPKGAGGKAGPPARRTSPLIIVLVAVLAVVVVGALAVAVMQGINKSGGSTASGVAEGARKGPADAEVKVLIFSDFQ